MSAPAVSRISKADASSAELDEIVERIVDAFPPLTSDGIHSLGDLLSRAQSRKSADE
ncbi:hypothetical protein [Helcobacillus massiliensis]|uniref:Uncharacterized protein n=1 Tax=Helcobacillus massiliensis TaxID=521392 RepID=A0A839QY05_9MICO|nr:hypothetical protein [Helcobacillus massiliensis]MBB3022841.1 hypothetical protein [Helcobacillus massiliensis]